MYSIDGGQVQDVVLGLRVKSDLPDPMAVLLTVAQNRFLLNSLRGEGFLNMRLTDAGDGRGGGHRPGAAGVRRVHPGRAVPDGARRRRVSSPARRHDTLFLPALLQKSPFWRRVEEGLRLFGVDRGEPDRRHRASGSTWCSAPRFTAQLFGRTATTPGTFGFLLGDAANAIHFWPGRGLNSGLAAAAVAGPEPGGGWRGKPLRDADFVRHEALMAMLQYRHKSRAWRQMVTVDADGDAMAIKDRIAQGITAGTLDAPDRDADLAALMERLRRTRTRLAGRLPGLPDDATLRAHLERLDDRDAAHAAGQRGVGLGERRRRGGRRRLASSRGRHAAPGRSGDGRADRGRGAAARRFPGACGVSAGLQ